MPKIEFIDEARPAGTLCCAQRMRDFSKDDDLAYIKGTLDPQSKLRMQVSEMSEPHPYHTVYNKLEIDLGEGAGFETLELPEQNYLDDNRLTGAWAHYPYAETSQTFLIPNEGSSDKSPLKGTHLAFTYKGGKWTIVHGTHFRGELLGVSNEQQFVFLNSSQEIALFDPHTLIQVKSIALKGDRNANAHLSEDRSQALIINLDGSEVVYNYVDLRTATSTLFKTSDNSSEVPSGSSHLCSTLFPMNEPERMGGVMSRPCWGKDSYQIRVEVRP